MPTIEQARAWYSPDDPVHGFDHVVRVVLLADRLAQAEGADREIVRAAALLHDAQPPAADPGAYSLTEQRSEHHLASASFARQILCLEGWSEARIAAVEHAIRAHRFRRTEEAPQTIEARVLYDADKLDAIGATGAARAVAYAASRGQPFYFPPSPTFLAEGRLEPGEPHSAYHEYVYKLAHIQDRLHTPAAAALANERHRRMAEFFDALARESSGGERLTDL